MSAENYIRIDLWRYIKADDEYLKGWYSFTRKAVNYAYILILIYTTICTIIIAATQGASFLLSLLNIILWWIWVRNNMIGNVVLWIDNRIHYHYYYTKGFNPKDYPVEVYNTKKAERYSRTWIVVIWVLIFIATVALAIIGDFKYSMPDMVPYWSVAYCLEYQFMAVWWQRKSIIRRFNIHFGI